MKTIDHLQSEIAALMQSAPAGPSTSKSAGHQRIALDGLTNAVTGQNMFLEEHEYPAYMDLGAQYIAELRPVGVRETQLAQKIIDLNWRLNTLSAVENNLFHSARVRQISPSDTSDDRVIGMTSKADAWRSDCEGPNAFEKLGRHEMRVQRTLTHMTAEFERFQAMRLKKSGDTFVLETCKAWIWYDHMLALNTRLVAERRAQEAERRAQDDLRESAPAESPSPAPSETYTPELLCKKAETSSPDAFHAAAVPILKFAAANGLLTPEQEELVVRLTAA